MTRHVTRNDNKRPETVEARISSCPCFTYRLPLAAEALGTDIDRLHASLVFPDLLVFPQSTVTMKLLTHNMLTSKCLRNVQVGFPLKIVVCIA